jgi:hypothetical protein
VRGARALHSTARAKDAKHRAWASVFESGPNRRGRYTHPPSCTALWAFPATPRTPLPRLLWRERGWVPGRLRGSWYSPQFPRDGPSPTEPPGFLCNIALTLSSNSYHRIRQPWHHSLPKDYPFTARPLVLLAPACAWACPLLPVPTAAKQWPNGSCAHAPDASQPPIAVRDMEYMATVSFLIRKAALLNCPNSLMLDRPSCLKIPISASLRPTFWLINRLSHQVALARCRIGSRATARNASASWRGPGRVWSEQR